MLFKWPQFWQAGAPSMDSYVPLTHCIVPGLFVSLVFVYLSVCLFVVSPDVPGYTRCFRLILYIAGLIPTISPGEISQSR